jgi:hypothetical protein
LTTSNLWLLFLCLTFVPSQPNLTHYFGVVDMSDGPSQAAIAAAAAAAVAAAEDAHAHHAQALIEDVLQSSRQYRPGSYAIHGQLDSIPLPSLHVDGIDDVIPLPLPKVVARVIICQNYRASHISLHCTELCCAVFVFVSSNASKNSNFYRYVK